MKTSKETSTPKKQTEPVSTSAPQADEHAHLIGKRIIFKNAFARVKYAGNLVHEIDNPKIKKEDLWLGIEWEDKSKGEIFSARF